MGGGDDAHVDRDVGVAADAAEGARLEHAQQLGLEPRSHLPDLVEEQRAAVGQLEQSLAELLGVGERALLVAVQLALEQLLGDRAAVELDERSAGARAVTVEVARHQLLAGAGLAEDQHGRRAALAALSSRWSARLSARASPMMRLLAQRAGAQVLDLALEPGVLERPREHDAQVFEVGRLEHEVVGAELRRLHRVLDRAVAGEHDHRQRRVLLAQPLAARRRPSSSPSFRSSSTASTDCSRTALERLAPARGLERG